MDGTETINIIDGSPRLLSKAEVIEFTGKTYPTLWQWIREGRFPAPRQVGDRAMWLSTEIKAWFDACPAKEYKALTRKAVRA